MYPTWSEIIDELRSIYLHNYRFECIHQFASKLEQIFELSMLWCFSTRELQNWIGLWFIEMSKSSCFLSLSLFMIWGSLAWYIKAVNQWDFMSQKRGNDHEHHNKFGFGSRFLSSGFLPTPSSTRVHTLAFSWADLWLASTRTKAIFRHFWFSPLSRFQVSQLFLY